MSADQWADSAVKEKKQAEFLVEDRFPWNLISAIGIMKDETLMVRINEMLENTQSRPSVQFQPSWYY